MKTASPGDRRRPSRCANARPRGTLRLRRIPSFPQVFHISDRHLHGLVLQLLFTGIGIGSVYALVALGFVLIFRATNVGELRARRVLDGRRLSDGGFRGRSGLAVLAVVPAGAGWHGATRRDFQSRGLLSAASSQLPARHHCNHRRFDPAIQFGAGDLRAAAAGAGGLVRNARAFSSARSISTASIC